MTEASSQRHWHWAFALLSILLLLVFLKNAWVCDDAYIIFRSLEQLYAGNGPNWNPHERVQGYTSPLWYMFLALARAVSADHFFNVILLSLLLFLLLGMLLHRYFGNGAGLVVSLLLAAGSSAFFDFTTSGLENILCYLVVSLAMLSGLAALRATDDVAARRHYWRALLAFALVPVCRHDLLVLTFLPALVLISEFQTRQKPQHRYDGVLVFVPLAVWSVFSLVYYGALFPNTAYAKLLTGISRLELLTQGLHYLWETFVGDPVTMLVIFAGMTAAIIDERRFCRAFAAGLAFNLVYIVWVGGDFMRGRFLSVPFVAALLLMVETRYFERLLVPRPSLVRGLAVVLVCFLFIFPHTPVNTGLSFQDFSIHHGIADERGYYFDVCSLYAYLYSRPGEVFPDFEWSQIGRQIAASGVGYLENDFNGMLGFWAGTRPIIVDRLALTDPFLARRPVSSDKNWRIGHFKRDVPDDYRLSIETGQNRFRDPAAVALYDKVLLATRDPQFFSFKRLLAIVKLNAGMN